MKESASNTPLKESQQMLESLQRAVPRHWTKGNDWVNTQCFGRTVSPFSSVMMPRFKSRKKS